MDSGLTSRTPSGLFPSNRPARPTYREPHPIRFAAVLSGAAAATVWQLLFSLLAVSARSYAWLTLASGALAGIAALVLARFGDRGAAVGVALVTTVAVSVAVALVVTQWVTVGWPLW
jgi:hypothetical protein